MVLVHLEGAAGDAIRRTLAHKGIERPMRIDLHSTGCCDASLGLLLDEIHEADLVQECEGLTFVMAPDVYRLTGEVKISSGPGDAEFVLKSEKPIGEWDGFGTCRIRT